MEKLILRPDEAATYLNCSKKTIYRLCYSAQLESFKLGNQKGLRIIRKSIDDFVRRQISAAALENGFFFESDVPTGD